MQPEPRPPAGRRRSARSPRRACARSCSPRCRRASGSGSARSRCRRSATPAAPRRRPACCSRCGRSAARPAASSTARSRTGRRSTACTSWVAALLPLSLLPMALAPSVPVMALLVIPAGMFIAPLLATRNELIGWVAPEGARTEAYTWPVTAFVGGIAIGSAVAGAIVEGPGWRTAFVVAGAVAAVGTVVVAVRRNTLDGARDGLAGRGVPDDRRRVGRSKPDLSCPLTRNLMLHRSLMLGRSRGAPAARVQRLDPGADAHVVPATRGRASSSRRCSSIVKQSLLGVEDRRRRGCAASACDPRRTEPTRPRIATRSASAAITAASAWSVRCMPSRRAGHTLRLAALVAVPTPPS